ncbi:hypothetical protein HBH75_101550 [Parastagonospora nodorum]|nr:hypothetical protein HBH75_101550 [Parastagonospora nodorum]
MNLALLLNLQEARKRVLYKQAAAQTSLSAEPACKNTNQPICSSFFLYEQAAAQTSLSAEYCNADCINNNNNNIALTLQFSLTALLNLQSLASKRSASSSSDLNCRRTNPTIARFNGSSSLKLQKTSSQAPSQTEPLINLIISNNNNIQLVRDNIEELIYISKVKNNRNNLNIIVTNPTGREFGRVDIKSLTRLSSEGPLGSPFLGLISMTLQLYYKQNDSLTQIQAIDPIISKSDKVPTRELSSHIKTELYPHQKQALYFMLRNNSRKFYRLIITSKDTHSSLILFIT